MYQIKRARSYVEEHSIATNVTAPNIDFPIEECTEQGIHNIIRIRFQSAHRNNYTYCTYIQFDQSQVTAWYCTCPIGARVVGCCSHVAAAIWKLSYERHNPTTTAQLSTTNARNIDYADDISDFEPSSDDEENDTLYFLNA